MLCEKCGKNQANTLIRESINGNVKEIHLCGECAAELGYNNLFHTFNPFEDMAVNLQGILGSLFSQGLPEQTVPSGKKCSFCGTTFEELAQSAMAGCANCYHEFYQELLPSIQRIHGKTRHVGKIPGTAGKELKLKKELEGLQKQLSDLVAAQEYEKAAILRDQIKDLEKKVQEQ
jgi:protein arginine kinase activator